jgi:hypothetical protein
LGRKAVGQSGTVILKVTKLVQNEGYGGLTELSQNQNKLSYITEFIYNYSSQQKFKSVFMKNSKCNNQKMPKDVYKFCVQYKVTLLCALVLVWGDGDGDRTETVKRYAVKNKKNSLHIAKLFLCS